MFFTFSIFGLSLFAMILMVVMKMKEIENEERNKVLLWISRKFDPLAGDLVGFYNCLTVSSFGRFMSLFGAKIGILVANILFYLKNKFSKFAAKLYHHSRKIEVNSANQPSLFIKTIKEYRETLRRNNEDKDDKK